MTESADSLGGGLSPEQQRRLLQYASESAARQVEAGLVPTPQPLDEQLAYLDSQIAALTADAPTDSVPDYVDQDGAAQHVIGLREQLRQAQLDILSKDRYILVLETAVQSLIDGVPDQSRQLG